MTASELVEGRGERVALVIGNSDYRKGPPLANPVTDAAAIAAAFERLGFSQVAQRFDLDKSAQDQELRKFTALAKSSDMAVVYYAGHGMELDGENYLLPVDAELGDVSSLGFEATRLSDVMRAVEGARNFRFVILDACRDNPFRGRMQGMEATRSMMSRGLAAVEPPGNTLVAYAARHGTTAKDGAKGANSPYAAALLNRLETPNMDVRLVLGHVRDDVMAATNNQQQPFFYGTLGGAEIALKRVPVAAAPAPLAPGDQAALLRALEEERDWERALRANSVESLESFRSAWTGGRFTAQIDGKIAEIREAQEKAEWEAALKSKRTPDFEKFRQRWPDGKFFAESGAMLEAAQDREQEKPFEAAKEAWKSSVAAYNKPEPLRAYLAQFSNHRNADEVRSRLAQMDKAYAEAYEREVSRKGAQRYLELFPNGASAVAAREFVNGAGDDKCWIKALGATDDALESRIRKKALEAYIEDWPEGRHIPEAKKKLDDIKGRQWWVDLTMGLTGLTVMLGGLWIAVMIAAWAAPQLWSYMPSSLDDIRKFIARQIEPAQEPEPVSPEVILEQLRKRKAAEDALKNGGVSNPGLIRKATPGADSNGPNPFTNSTSGDLGSEAAAKRLLDGATSPTGSQDNKPQQ